MHDIRSFLRSHGLKLNTDLGQHFLVDEDVLTTIVETAKIESTDHIVEIGPGIGILTAELLKKEAKVTAIELDERLIPLLKTYVNLKLQTTNYKLQTINGNALSTPFPKTPYKIVANIPYHITSPLLRHAFLESAIYPSSMTLLIQREVAEKITDTKNHGLLTILVCLFGKPSFIRTVKPEAFLPPPKVDSAVLHIECFEKPLADNATIEEIFRLTKIAFSQKRKMLSNTIGALQGGMEAMQAAGINPMRRPQTVKISEWISLADIFLAQ